MALDRVPGTQLWAKQAAIPALTRCTFKSYKQNPKQINIWLCQKQNKNLCNAGSIDRGTIIYQTHQVSLAGLRKISIRTLRSQVSASKENSAFGSSKKSGNYPEMNKKKSTNLYSSSLEAISQLGLSANIFDIQRRRGRFLKRCVSHHWHTFQGGFFHFETEKEISKISLWDAKCLRGQMLYSTRVHSWNHTFVYSSVHPESICYATITFQALDRVLVYKDESDTALASE